MVPISIRWWVYPRVIVRPERLCQWKIRTTLSRIAPATFPLIAQCLKQLRHRGHPPPPPRSSQTRSEFNNYFVNNNPWHVQNVSRVNQLSFFNTCWRRVHKPSYPTCEESFNFLPNPHLHRVLILSFTDQSFCTHGIFHWSKHVIIRWS
jgi:hypothetical protein